jgi:protein-L-isoaspartate O-methyltransferase
MPSYKCLCELVLEIGTGLGFQASVYSIEIIDEPA